MKRDLFSILDDLSSGLDELRHLLSPLAAIAAGTTGVRRAATGPALRAATRTVRRKVKTTGRPRKPVSSAVRAKRILQGRYLAAIRPLGKGARARVKAVQAQKGHEAAIKLAASLKK